MLRYIIVIFLCLGSSSLLGVNFRFIDATDSITPIEAVFVQNVRTNELAYSDSDGGLNIPAIPGDSLFINSFGFRNEIFIVDSVVNSILFYLIREYLLLDPVEVLGMKVKFKSHIPKSRKHRLSTSSTIGYAYLKKFNGESVKSISKVRLKADIQKVNSAVLLLFVEWESDLIPHADAALGTALVSVEGVVQNGTFSPSPKAWSSLLFREALVETSFSRQPTQMTH